MIFGGRPFSEEPFASDRIQQDNLIYVVGSSALYQNGTIFVSIGVTVPLVGTNAIYDTGSFSVSGTASVTMVGVNYVARSPSGSSFVWIPLSTSTSPETWTTVTDPSSETWSTLSVDGDQVWTSVSRPI